MDVLLLNGSPHEKGCTFTALTEVKETLEKEGLSAEIVNIAKEGFTKEDVDRVATLALEADGLIIGSPVWYASSCGLSNYFLDLLFSKIGSKMRMKFGASVVSCRRGGASSTFDQLNKYFGINQMPIISSRYWNMVHGATPDDVRKDEDGMQIMRILGRNMAYYLKCIEAGKEKGIQTPKQEKINFTNFIR